MNVLDRKLLRDLRAAKGPLLAVTAIIAVGVLCYVYMQATYYNLKSAQDRYYAEGRMADFWIDVKKAPLAELRQIGEIPGVSEMQTRIQFYATVDLPEVAAPLNGLVLSLPDERRATLNDVTMRHGEYFSTQRRNEVIVNDAFARAHHLRPGQTMHLLLNNRRQELHIVGTAISSEFVYLLAPGNIMPDPEHFGVFYVKRTFAEEVFDFDGAANQVIGRIATGSRDHVDQIVRQAEIMLEPYGVAAATPRRNQLSHRFLSDEIAGLGVMATILPVVFLSVAALVLNVLISRMIQQQRTIIGTLKAVGYRDRQLAVHYLKFGALVGLIGGVIGSLLGYWTAGQMTAVYRQFFEFPNLDNAFYPGITASGIGISLACALAGSLQGVWSVLRLKPAEAMRPRPPAAGGRIWLERAAVWWQKLSFSWRMVLRGLVRNRLRTAVGVFAAAMGAALLMTGFTMMEATRFLVDFQYNKVSRSDYDLVFQSEQGEEALLEARRLPSVDLAEPIFTLGCTFVNGPYRRKGGVQGLLPDARLTVPRDAASRPIRLPSAGLVFSRKLAESLHLSVGDWVTIEPVKGQREPRRAPVARITDAFLGMSVYADIHYLSRLVGEELVVSGVQLKTNNSAATAGDLYPRLKTMPALQAVSARADVVHVFEKQVLETQSIFIGAFVFFAGITCFGAILNASLVNLAERVREVATLRVLGYSPGQVAGMFLKESLLITLAGAALGLPLGYALATLISELYDTEMFRFPVVSPPRVWLLSMGLTLLFGLLAHLFVRRVIHRMDYLEALNVKE